ncbi:hypothetical protein WKV44_03325 [Spirochaetia bacterium 38H-sp]|uniref:Photosystem I assembly protein Ycf4 n=1 Tax=Rarispira pelagica TaxID=3141764 RepID=A0ABU9UA71_9SPIR
MQISLQYKTNSNKAYLCMPLWYRIISIIFFVFSSAAYAISYPNPIALFLCLLLFISSGYVDTWIFDKDKGKLYHSLGWAFIRIKKESLQLKDIKAIEVDSSTAYKKLVIVSTNGRKIILDIKKGKHSEVLKNIAEKLIIFLNI